MNEWQAAFDALQIVINVSAVWYMWHLHGRIGKLSAGHTAMQGSLDERTINQAEYDAMSDEQKDANQADYGTEQKKSAES